MSEEITNLLIALIPSLASVSASVAVIVKFILSFKDLKKTMRDDNELARYKKDTNKRLDKLENYNADLLEENIKLKKTLNKYIELETKVKQDD